MNKLEKIVSQLRINHETISTMESCTGGMLASFITNIAKSSEVFKYGAVTYSNEYKIKMGVDAKIIEEYGVYSLETAIAMSKAISYYANADYGIGITGKLHQSNLLKKELDDKVVYFSIYQKSSNKCYTQIVKVTSNNRIINKKQVIKKIIEMLNQVID